MIPRFDYEIRPVGVEGAADLFVVQAAISPVDAGQLLDWTADIEDRLEHGSVAWAISAGRRTAGYALIDPLPGLPGVYDLSGGVVPARRRQGLGDRLLRHVLAAAGKLGASQVSCRVERLDDDPADFLLRRGFYVEHGERLLELTDLAGLPAIPEQPEGRLVSYPQSAAIAEFRRIYDESFTGTAWYQPYSEEEVALLLARAEDLLLLEVDGRPVGVVWHELMPEGTGRIEPIGVVPGRQRQGYGRRLMLAALHNLRHRGASKVQIGLWSENAAALNLYESLGFLQVEDWYYLAYDLEGLKGQ